MLLSYCTFRHGADDTLLFKEPVTQSLSAIAPVCPTLPGLSRDPSSSVVGQLAQSFKATTISAGLGYMEIEVVAACALKKVKGLLWK